MRLFGWGRTSSDRRPLKTSHTIHERAWKAFAEDDFKTAVDHFEEWTESEPNSAVAWFGYAWSKFRASSELGLADDELFSQFRSLAEKSLRLNDALGELQPHQLAGVHLLLGFADKFSGKQKAAMAHFQYAIDAAPESPMSVQARIELAAQSVEDGDVPRAEGLLREASRFAPDDPKVLAGMKILEERGGRLRVRFRVIQFPKMEHIEVLAHPDETLGDIATREFPKYGLNTTGVRFIYSGDNAIPSDIYFGDRERHHTLRQIGLKDGDSISCMVLAGSPVEEESFGIRLIRDHLDHRHPRLAQREMRRVIERANRDLDAGELEKALGTAEQLAKVLPHMGDPAALLDRVRDAIRQCDAGCACPPVTSWFHSHGCPSRTSHAASTPTPPLDQLWEFRPASGTLTTPVVHLRNVFTGCSDQYVYCLDAHSGVERWRWRANTVLEQTPAATATALYVPDRESLTRLDLNSGDLIWQEEYAQPSSPAILDRQMYIATRAGQLYRLNLDTGKVDAALETGIPNLHTIAIDSSRVLGLSNSCAVCADLALRKVLWHREGEFGETTPVLAWDRAYLCTQREGLWCLDANEGRLVWIFATEAPVKAAPSVARGRLFFGDVGGRFGCLNAWTGELLWRPGDWLINEIACSTSPITSNSFVYVLLDNGALYCLEMLSGNEVWSAFAFEAEGGLGALATTSDALYATSRLGTLVCFGTPKVVERTGTIKRTAASIPPRTNLLALRSNTNETEKKDVQMLDFGRPTGLLSDELNSLHRATFFAMNNRLDEATAMLQRLQHDHPHELIVLYNLGNVYEWQGLVGEALAIFDHLLELDPGDAYAFSALGRLLRTHPDLITDVFGEAGLVETTTPPIFTWIDGTDAVPLLNSGNAEVAFRIDTSLVNAVSTGPVWCWWQMVETDHGVVLRLYLEFDYQPYKIHDVLQPLNVRDPQVDEWLDHLELQDSFTIFCFDDQGKFRFARKLNHSAEQRERLRKIHQRAAMQAKGETADSDFDEAVREAESRWEQRQKLGK